MTFDPGRRAASTPRPISTALIAWMLITARASRASSLRSHWAWLPRPIGQPVDDRLDDPAQRVAGLLGRVDRGDDRRVGLGVERVDRAGVADRQVEAKAAARRSRPARGRSRRP